MVFINSTFSGNLEAAMEVPYGVATLSLLMNTTGTGGEWFEVSKFCIIYFFHFC